MHLEKNSSPDPKLSFYKTMISMWFLCFKLVIIPYTIGQYLICSNRYLIKSHTLERTGRSFISFWSILSVSFSFIRQSLYNMLFKLLHFRSQSYECKHVTIMVVWGYLYEPGIFGSTLHILSHLDDFFGLRIEPRASCFLSMHLSIELPALPLPSHLI